MQATQSPRDPNGILPHQQSQRVTQHLDPEQTSINDDFQDAKTVQPGASTYNGNNLEGAYPALTHGNPGRPSAERRSGDSLRHGERRAVVPGEKDSQYSGSSGTFRDEETHGLDFRIGTPRAQSSSSTIEDLDGKHPATNQADQADGPSGDSSHDLEKGHTGSKEHHQVSQDDEENEQTQTQWKNNVVGWDGPNDPQNPMNWTKSKKYTVTVFYASLTFCVTFASSIFSTATEVTAKTYGVSSEVMTLGTSLFVFVSAGFLLHPSYTDNSNRVLPSAQLFGVLSPNSTVERSHYSSDSSSSPSFKYLSP